MKKIQYSSRAMLALVSLSCIACAIGVAVDNIRNRDLHAIVALERYGVTAIASDSPSLCRSKIVVFAECHGQFPPEVIHIISTLSRLESLGFSESRLSDTDLQTLAHFHYLRSLDVSYTSLTDASIPTLLGLESLNTLQIAGSQITANGTAQLLAKGRLAHLSLDGKQASPIQWGIYDNATVLRTLWLVGESVTCESATRAARDSGVQSLVLYRCGLSSADMDMVVQSAAPGTSVVEMN